MQSLAMTLNLGDPDCGFNYQGWYIFSNEELKSSGESLIIQGLYNFLKKKKITANPEAQEGNWKGPCLKHSKNHTCWKSEQLLKNNRSSSSSSSRSSNNNIGFGLTLRTREAGIGRKTKRLVKVEEEIDFIGRKVYGLWRQAGHVGKENEVSEAGQVWKGKGDLHGSNDS